LTVEEKHVKNTYQLSIGDTISALCRPFASHDYRKVKKKGNTNITNSKMTIEKLAYNANRTTIDHLMKNIIFTGFSPWQPKSYLQMDDW
jgi:hypothetical protein